MIFTKKCFFVKKMQKMVGGVKKTLTFSFCPENDQFFQASPGIPVDFFAKKSVFVKNIIFPAQQILLRY